MRPRLATLVLFFVNGVVLGTWVASIPGTQARLGMTATELGLVLLVAALGSLIGQQVTGQLLVRYSSRRITMVGALLFPLMVPLFRLAPDPLVLAAVMFAFGFVNATMDLSMNAHGVAIETKDGRSIVSTLHAGWSLGAFCGAMAVALATSFGVDGVLEAVLVGVLLWLVVALVIRRIGTGSRRTEGASGIHLPSRRALPLALLIIPVAFAAGGMGDWGGVYLRQGLGTSAQLAAFAFAAYSLGLLLGRSAGDVLKDRVGSVRLMQGGTVIAAAAMTIFLIVGNPYLALIGLTITGIGLANNYPQMYGAAGRITPVGPSLSAVFAFSTLTFMVEPAVMGIVSDAVGIRAAMWLPVVAVLLIAVGVGRVPAVETNARFAPRMATEPLV
jgi:MFS family permease